MKAYKEELGLCGWCTMWSKEDAKNWGFGGGFAGYVNYLASPDTGKQPWMRDENPHTWYDPAVPADEFTIASLLAANGRAPGYHARKNRSGMRIGEIADGT